MASLAVALCLGALVKRRVIARPGAPEVTTGPSRSIAVASLALWTIAIVAGRLIADLKSTV
jgi:hypothetical protein